MKTNNNQIVENSKRMQSYEENISDENSNLQGYLSAYSLSPTTISRYHIGYSPIGENELSGRLIYPWFSEAGDVLGFAGRIIDMEDCSVAQKFIISKGMNEIATHHLYGLFQAIESIRQENNVYIVDGYSDVLSLYERGVHNVVSCSGRTLTEEHIKMLQKLTNNVTLLCCLWDEDVRCIVAHNRKILTAAGINVQVVMLPDWDDAEGLARCLCRNTTELKDYLKSNVMTEQQLTEMHV